MPSYRTPVRQARRSLRMSRSWFVLPAILAAIGICCLQWQTRRLPPADSGNAMPGAPVSSERGVALLRKMQQAYQQMSSYSDRTQMDLRLRRDGQWIVEHAELDVTWQQPDELALRVIHGARQFHVAAANRKLQARIDDPQVPEFNNQVVSRQLDGKIALTNIYSAFEIVNPQEEDVKHGALTSLPAPLSLSPLAVLLDTTAVDNILRGSIGTQLLPESSWRGQAVERVRVTTEQGSVTFWIDAESNRLHRVDFPAPPVEIEAQMFSLTAKFSDVQIDRPLSPSTFRFSVPPQTQTVQHFVMPPSIQAPRHLGDVIDQLDFTDVWGNATSSESWNSQLAVIVWFNKHNSSRGVLTELEQLSKTAEGCSFLAVCTEPTTAMSHSDVAELARQWNLTIPVVRDLAARGRDALGIERAPTIVVLDQDRRVQLLEEGGDTNLDQELAEVLARLNDGEDLASTFRADVNRQWETFRQALTAAATLQ